MDIRFSFTDDERDAMQRAYAALTRVGNETAINGEWQEYIDKAHHYLALTMMLAGITDLFPPDV